MLERIALHQTRLRTPGLGLDAKGVALGAKGLVLLPSIERLVALLAVYTRDRSLEDLLPSLALTVVRSPLGTRELTLEVAAESSDRMDRLAETARLVGAFTFTGTSRHFVQYRDAAAPFGYDAPELLATELALAVYHDRFSQAYAVERPLDLRALLLRLAPHLDPATRAAGGPLWVVAEQGLGPALVQYLVRSLVDGDVCAAEWPPESAFDDAPLRRTVVRVPELPARMRGLVFGTPGLTAFAPVGPGVAVEVGYRHPIELRACPVFDPNGLVLVRGRGDEPWALERLPQMGPLRAFARVELRADAGPLVAVAARVGAPDAVRVPLRLAPTTAPWRNVTAAWVPAAQLGLLRRLAYALPRDALARTVVATTAEGAFLRDPAGIEGVPLGTFFVELHPGLHVPAGWEPVPAVAPAVLHEALGGAPDHVLFVLPGPRVIAVAASAFTPLATALLAAPPLEVAAAEAVAAALDEAPVELRLEPLGLLGGASGK